LSSNTKQSGKSGIDSSICGLPFTKSRSFEPTPIGVLQAGQVYVIDLESTAFDAALRLHDGQGKLLAANDDIEPGVNLNSRLIITVSAAGRYRLVATSFDGGTGAYTLTVRSFAEAKK
jgi:hypothetical protein